MSSDVAVFDASPLIIFDQIGYFAVLRELFHQIVVPTAVAQEVAPSLGRLPFWIEERSVTSISNLPRKLDRGERATIALAIHLSVEFIALDDLAGRRVAADLGFTVIGSLGLLVRAKRRGLIKDVRPAMDQMVVSGRYVSEEVYHEILEAAGESIR